MPFLVDHSWPAGLLTIFEHARAKRDTFENRYYGPYDKLLNYCFGDNFTFYVAPQYLPMDDSCDALDRLVFLVVFDARSRPVFFVDVRDDIWAERAELRHRADMQMQNRYAMMLEDCHIPNLWGLSLLGTKMRVYCGDKASYTVNPEALPRPEPSTRLLPRHFLAGMWNMDILSQEGFQKVKEMVADAITYTHVYHDG